MKKSIMTMAMATVLVLSTSMSFATTAYTKYTYTQAVLENNFELTQLTDDLNDEIKDYRTALRSTIAIDELTWEEFDDNYNDSQSRSNAMEVKLYNPLKEGKEYHDKYAEMALKKRAITLEAEQKYYNYLNTLKNYEIKTSNYDLAKETYDSKVLEEELGQIATLDLIAYEKVYNDAIVEQLKAVGALEEARNSFNLLIDQPLTSEIELDQLDIQLPAFEVDSLEDTLTVLIDNSYQSSALQVEIDRLKMSRQVKGRTSGFGNVKVELDQNQIALDEAEEQLKDMPLTIEYQLRTKYNDTRVAKNVFRSAELQLEMAETNLNVAKVKERNDMLSALEVIKSQQDYNNALNTYFDAKLQAYSAIVAFNDFVEVNSQAVPMDLK